MQTPDDTEGKRRILRSLMNIRMPRKMDEAILAVQDEYLQERVRENGIVELAANPVIRDRMSIWQGDITRLAVDAIVNAANSQMLGCFVPMHTCIDGWEGRQMQLKKIDADFTVCKLKNPDGIDMTQEYCFIGKTDEELSLVYLSESLLFRID